MATASGSQPTGLARSNTGELQCWICYQTPSETPTERWANACPCTLEAHEKCLLEWITREEHDGRAKDGVVKCPQCKATVRTEEPYDAVFALRNTLYKNYSRISPGVLLSIFATGSIAGSAWYGYQSFAVFAGPDRVNTWIFGRRFRGLTPSIMIKFFGLAHIGPAMVIARLIPRIEYLALPFSTVYAFSLMHRDPLQTWPPSPEWIITLMPCIHLTYISLYRRLFGPLEKRLNKTLRGGNLDNVYAGGGDAAAPANDPPARNEPGFLDNAFDMANAVIGLFQGGGGEGGLEVELRIDAGVADDDDGEVIDLGQPAEGGEAAPPPAVPAADAPVQQAPAQPQPAQQEQNNNNNQNQNRNRQQNDIVWPTLTDVMNNVATSLALPTISWLMGELIRKAISGPSLTSGFLRRRGYNPAPTGLLQHRWGRSLVGGCFFIVLKDALVLYAKYRGAEAKKNRRIKEVPKRNGNFRTITAETVLHPPPQPANSSPVNF
ncbi:hypothetical protein V8F33_003000 [Rhypophila sp. PSN 637]